MAEGSHLELTAGNLVTTYVTEQYLRTSSVVCQHQGIPLGVVISYLRRYTDVWTLHREVAVRKLGTQTLLQKIVLRLRKTYNLDVIIISS